ncbi:hypothetical protein PGTUg99_021270 [Puccinia graminis f. sp. tritici]|uniref:Uncharacterized protein n=1 Tax=Puccinia graminis f. sp. tritici TaxID=56615 RepID=A0A5B0Q0Z8_PUCGR|nr:hypothetical protein PGTUg99_021270 [Puccinia graminis f. sp. tritici]
MSDFNSNPLSPKIDTPSKNELAAIKPPFSNHSAVGERLTTAVSKTPAPVDQLQDKTSDQRQKKVAQLPTH